MEMTLVLQDPALTAHAGRAPAAAASADASMLFASTLQQELAEPGFVIGNLTESSPTPQVQRAELAEWLRSFQDGRAAELAPQADSGSTAPLLSRPDNPETAVVTLLPGSSAALSALPEEPAAEESAPVIPTTPIQTGVIIGERVVAATASVPPLEAATPAPENTATHADTGVAPALAQAAQAAQKAQEAPSARTPDSTRGEKRPGTLPERTNNTRQKLQTATAIDSAAAPVMQPASAVLQDFQHDMSRLDQAALAPQADAETAIAESALEQVAMPQTAASPAQAASAAVTDQTDSPSSHALRRSFAIANGVTRVAGSGKDSSSTGFELPLSESTNGTAGQPEKTLATVVANDSGHQAAARNNSFRSLSAHSALPGSADTASDKLFQAVAPQPVLAPQPDAGWMQQALALAALNHSETASSTPEIRSANAAEPVFTLSSEISMGAEGWGEEVGSHISWLSEQNISKAELTLHPAELGAIDITINNEDDRITVSIVTRNEAARELLQDNLPRLAELLRQNGLALEQGSVSQHSAGQREQQAASAHGRTHGGDNQDSAAADTPRLRSALLHQGQIDHYV